MLALGQQYVKREFSRAVCTVCVTYFVYVSMHIIPSLSCIQELPEAMSTTKRCANNSAELFIIPETTQLAMVATVYQGTVVKVLPTQNCAG